MEIESTENRAGEHGSTDTLQRVIQLESQLLRQGELLAPLVAAILDCGLTEQLELTELLSEAGYASLASAVNRIILHATMRLELGDDYGI